MMGKQEKSSVREELLRYRQDAQKKKAAAPRDAVRKSTPKKKKVKEAR